MSCLRYDLKSGISPPQSFSALPQFTVGITRIPLEAQQAPHQRLECFAQQKRHDIHFDVYIMSFFLLKQSHQYIIDFLCHRQFVH